MILFKDGKVETKEIESKKLDGIYTALITDSIQLDDGINSGCYIYIPEVYGVNYNLINEKYDYPLIEIPLKQDLDDEGKLLPIGSVIRVSFDDGNSQSCRYISTVPISNEVEAKNRYFIENGVLPSEILEIDDPMVIKKMKEYLSDAYYLTLGKYEPYLSDFKVRNIIATNTGYYHYFLKPLNMPIAAYSTQNVANNELTLNMPDIFSSNIYSFFNVMLKLYENNPQSLIEVFNHPLSIDTAGVYMYDISQVTLEDNKKCQFLTNILSGIPYNPASIEAQSILFPEIKDNNYFEGFQFNKFVIEPGYWWYNTSRQKTTDDKDYFSEMLYNNRSYYEDLWAKACACWYSGINNIVFTNSISTKRLVLYCLICCPWMSNILLGYDLSNINNSIINKFYQSLAYQATIKFNYSNDKDKQHTMYFSLLGSKTEKAGEIATKLRNAIPDEDTKEKYNNFIDVFMNEAEALFSKNNKELVDGSYPVDEGTTYFVDKNNETIKKQYSISSETINDSLWVVCGFPYMFGRLKSLVDKIIEEQKNKENNFYNSTRTSLATPPVSTNTAGGSQGTNIQVPQNSSYTSDHEGIGVFKSYQFADSIYRYKQELIDTGIAKIEPSTGLYHIDGYYMVAMASYYSVRSGELYQIRTDKGNAYNVVLVDFKDDSHTDSKHMYTTKNGCVTEFIADYDTFPIKQGLARRTGNVDYIPRFSGKIISIQSIGYLEKADWKKKLGWY